jgi:hypothetical protein
MTALFKRLVPAALALFVCATAGLADAPNGQITFSFGVDDVPVYDLGGFFQFDQTLIASSQTEFPLSYGINLTQNNQGFLSGAGVTAVNVGDNFFAADYTARGRVSVRQGSTRVTLTVRLKGQDFIAGVLTSFSINITYVLFVNPETGVLEGTARGSANFGRLGGGKIRSDISVGLPPGADGSWTLVLNVITLNRVAGTGFIVLSNGRTLALNVSGRYSPNLDRSTIRASGFGDSRGNSVTITSDPLFFSLRGTIFGQSVRE